MNRFKTAFTLAEVLITLVIVGIVASMTIPTVISSTNEMQYTAGAKKINSDLINALRAIQVNGGEVIPEGTGLQARENNEALLKQFCSVMSCASVSHGEKNFFADNYKYYNSSMDFGSLEGTDNQVVLNNGTAMAFSTGYCSPQGICGGIVVDINGPKGPNMEAVDFYDFNIYKEENGYFSMYPAEFLDSADQPSVDWAIGICSEYHACSGVRIYAPDKLPKT